MKIERQRGLRELNSFCFDVMAESFCAPTSNAELVQAVRHAAGSGQPLLVLGSGSNVVLSGNWPGLVVHPALAGIEVLHEDAERVLIRVGAGEDWPELVQTTLAAGWYGLENLSLIPGTAGAAPIQNIGAYGVELREFLHRVEVMELADQSMHKLSPEDCAFAYRDSLFKGAARDRYVITAIELVLSRQARLRTSYGEIEAQLDRMGIDRPTPEAVSEAVIAIRRRKLPDPAQLPNAGSFFKNPVVSAAQHADLKKRFPELVAYPLSEGRFKLAAGWLIEQCGWKGFRRGDAGVHEAQALVLVNHGQATGQDILALARDIQADVRSRYGVELEIEPRIY